MSNLEYLFFGDYSWQFRRMERSLNRINASLEQSRQQAQAHHREVSRALQRVEDLHQQQVALARQREQMLASARDEDARRRQITGALIVHESELDQIIGLRRSLEAESLEDPASDGGQQLVVIKDSLIISAALKARAITMATSLSGLTIAELPSLEDQRAFQSIQIKAQAEWSAFCATSSGEMSDQVELAALSTLCEMQLYNYSYLTVGYDHLINDNAAQLIFNGAFPDRIRSEASKAALAADERIKRIVIGFVMLLLAGDAWLFYTWRVGYAVLLFIGGLVLFRFGAAEVGSTRGSVMREAADKRETELWNEHHAGYLKVSADIRQMFKSFLNERLNISEGFYSAADQHLQSYAPSNFNRLGQDLVRFWNAIAGASPVASNWRVYDNEKNVLSSQASVNLCVQMVLAKEAIGREQ